MTEAKWLASDDLAARLANKLRLFACACARGYCWTPLLEPHEAAMLHAVEVHADGGPPPLYSEGTYRAGVSVLTHPAANAARVWSRRDDEDVPAEMTRKAGLLRDVVGNPWRPVTLPRNTLTRAVLDALEEAGCDASEWCPPAELGGCGGLGRVHAPLEGMPGAVPAYSGDRRGMVPCAACGGGGRISPLLSHLRSPGPHVRGCWALDLILGKE